VIDQLGVRLVEAGGQVGLGGGQADGVGDALAQGAGGHLHARGQEVLGVAGGLAAPLAERLQVGDLRAAAGGARAWAAALAALAGGVAPLHTFMS
jgi:hypothetical protein